jgi:IclR family transcriptional regulator, KDG regulon repressor
MPQDVSRQRYSVEAVQRLARICELFSPERPELNLREISSFSGIPVRTAAKIVATLEARGVLSGGAHSGRWSLGPIWLRIADFKRSRIDVRAAAIPVMQWIREELNETIILAVRVGDRRIIIECLISTQPVRRVSEVGDEVPLHVGSSGRTILSGLSDGEIKSYLARTQLINCGYDTVTDPARIWADVKRSRKRGFLTAAAEITKDSFSTSAAIRSYSGEVAAALTIIFPLSRKTDELRDESIRLAVEGARRISRRLGYALDREIQSAV